jgi:hypothetical protein
LNLRETEYKELPTKYVSGTTIEALLNYDNVVQHVVSAITINCETVFHGHGPHHSEKIFKCLLSGRPFIEVSAPNTLLDLKQNLGIETFPDLIDESYDQLIDPIQRIEKICNEINRLSQIPLIDLKEYIMINREKFEHNFNIVSTLYKKAINNNDINSLNLYNKG